MTNKEIEGYKQELCAICKIDNLEERRKLLVNLAIKLNAPIPAILQAHTLEFINEIIRNIHNSLQTEEMFNACVSAEQSCELAKQSSNTAKWACIWAAIAAISACISILLVLFCG